MYLKRKTFMSEEVIDVKNVLSLQTLVASEEVNLHACSSVSLFRCRPKNFSSVSVCYCNR